MAKSKKTVTVSPEEAYEEVVSALENFRRVLGDNGIDFSDTEDDEDDEVEDEDEEEVELTREMVEEATEEGIKALRTLAESVGVEEKKKADILAAFEEMLDDEDEDEEDDEDEDEEGFDRDELEEMTVAALRKLAKSEEGGGHSAADVKGLDQDDLIDLIMGEADEDEEEEDEDEEEEDDEDVEELDEDALKKMTQPALITLAKELDVKIPKKLQTKSAKNKTAIIDLILDSGEEE